MPRESGVSNCSSPRSVEASAISRWRPWRTGPFRAGDWGCGRPGDVVVPWLLSPSISRAVGPRLRALPCGFEHAVLASRFALMRSLRATGAPLTPTATPKSRITASTKPGTLQVKLSRRALHWALECLVVAQLTVARIAEGLAVWWNTANDAVLAEDKRLLITDPKRFDGVTAIGVDEHVWRHTRRGEKYVTGIIDLTPIRENTGPARLLDMVEGHSKNAFKTRLAGRPATWPAAVDVVAMDGFTGFKTATTEDLPDATAVMDPFHLVRLAGDDHVQLEDTYGVYQQLVATYRDPDRAKGRARMEAFINSISSGVPGFCGRSSPSGAR